jgi:hypothetical protein
MFIIDTNREDVLEDFPFIQEWIDTAQKVFIKKEIDESKIEFYYSYGFFVPKVENKQELYTDMYEKSSKMLFDDRLTFELSKVRVNITMKIGNFILSNRLEKGSVPEIVGKIVEEITKVKMTVEGDYHDNQEVIDSIPDIDPEIIKFEAVNEIVNKDLPEGMNFNMDDLLDKIGKKGMDSLSDEEKEFLDKKSKDL